MAETVKIASGDTAISSAKVVKNLIALILILFFKQ